MSNLKPLHRPGVRQLVQTYAGEIGGLSTLIVQGRELHTFLENRDEFAHWIKARIDRYGFIENQDFAIAWGNSQAKRGGHNRKDYNLTLDMAKELSMVENNAKGREARRYFISMERRAHARPAQDKPRHAAAPAQASAAEVQALLTQGEYIALLEQRLGYSPRSQTAHQRPEPAPEPANTARNLVTAAESAEILERFTAGETKCGIARALGRSPRTIGRVLERANGPVQNALHLEDDA